MKFVHLPFEFTRCNRDIEFRCFWLLIDLGKSLANILTRSNLSDFRVRASCLPPFLSDFFPLGSTFSTRCDGIKIPCGQNDTRKEHEESPPKSRGKYYCSRFQFPIHNFAQSVERISVFCRIALHCFNIKRNALNLFYRKKSSTRKPRNITRNFMLLYWKTCKYFRSRNRIFSTLVSMQ